MITEKNHKLILGDCLDVMRGMDSESIDLILTDPPYGMDFQSNRSKKGPRHKKIRGDSSLDHSWLRDAFRILSRKHGAIIIFCNWGTSCDWYRALCDYGFIVKSQIIWDRMHHGMGDLKGSFSPRHDIVWYAVAGGRRIFMNGRPPSVISYKRPSPSQDFGHPTCKPAGLMYDLFKSVQCSDTETVLDPFMGSGSTGVAVADAGSNFIGIEMEESYYSTAHVRVGRRYRATEKLHKIRFNG